MHLGSSTQIQILRSGVRNFSVKESMDLHDIGRKSFVTRRDANRPRDPNNTFFKEMDIS